MSVITITKEDLAKQKKHHRKTPRTTLVPAPPDLTEGGRWSSPPGATVADSPRQCMSHARQWTAAKRKRRRKRKR